MKAEPTAGMQAAAEGAGREGKVRKCLEGLWFTLVAVEGAREDYETAKQAVLKMGGNFFNKLQVELIKDAPEKAYALCPPSLTHARENQLDQTCSDFRIGEILLRNW